ncbi:hypothetical protein A0H81_13838 [Grifola frondosa]|uniref:Uncharacterized protein n=1 Tax=Grifola frondosa TaxID=5627 RepID=A0A1C7LPX5_GRIFR|nr:hypothetical protein A0H81_13838 [Grifola frondosa]
MHFAAVILGGIGGLICYIPSILAILSFLWIFNIDIRYPSQSRSSIRSWAGVVRSLLRDEASAARLGIVLVLFIHNLSKLRLMPRYLSSNSISSCITNS